jgi:hypothetical protein
MKQPHIPTELDIKAHEAMMEILSNLSAHMHFIDGWIGGLFPYKELVFRHDPAIFPQLIKAVGQCKIANKAIARKMLRNDEEAQILMFEAIGRSVKLIAALPPEKVSEYTEKLNTLYEETVLNLAAEREVTDNINAL